MIFLYDTQGTILILFVNSQTNRRGQTGTGNKLRYVDVTQIFEQLGPSLCRSLPGFHAFIGCDYNPAFFKKGKQRSFNIMKKNEENQQEFIRFGKVGLFADLDQI